MDGLGETGAKGAVGQGEEAEAGHERGFPWRPLEW